MPFLPGFVLQIGKFPPGSPERTDPGTTLFPGILLKITKCYQKLSDKPTNISEILWVFFRLRQLWELFILRVGLYGVCEFCVKFSRTDDFKSLQEGQYHEKDFSA